jgi:DNA-3-methyladenine glycosylase II
VRIAAAAGGVDVQPHDPRIELEVLHLLGAPFRLDPFYAWAEQDEVLRALTRELRGFRPPLAPDPFESLVTSITAQQVSLFSAFAIRNRLIERFGDRVGDAYAFPTRERVAAAGEDELVACGFSVRKAEYAVGLARADLDLAELALLGDEEIKERLVALRGIGEWTADWFLARHLARPSAWPAGDLALRKAAGRFYGEIADLRAFGARFDGYANLAAHYLLTGARMP